jgi:hypothetical protein
MGLVVVVASAVLVTGVGTAADGGPLADAGLDQTVPEGATVYLDGGGSVAPEGSIAAYEWTITAPNGTTFSPACVACEQTQFTPTQVGTYEVQLTVTDEAGRTDSDTLYVEVESHDPPEASVSGPESVDVGEPATVTLTAQPGDALLSSYLWRAGGQTHDQGFFDSGDEHGTAVTFETPGIRRVTATVSDLAGGQATAGTDIVVRSNRPYVAVNLTDIDSSIQFGTTLGVTARVHNVGREATTQDIRLETADGRVLAVAEDVSLGSNERRSVSLSWTPGPADVGRHDLVVASANETDAATVRVTPVSDGAYFDVAIEAVSHTLPRTPDVGVGGGAVGGQPGSATARVVVTNLGGEVGTQDIVLDGERGGDTRTGVDRRSLTLADGESRTLVLRWNGFTHPTDGDELAIVVRSADDSAREVFYEGSNDGGTNLGNVNDGVVIDPIGSDDMTGGDSSVGAVVDGSEDTIVVETDEGQDCSDLSVSGPGTVTDRSGPGCELEVSGDADNGDGITITDGTGESGTVQVGGGDDDDDGYVGP